MFISAFDDGSQKDLVSLNGTIPIMYRGIFFSDFSILFDLISSTQHFSNYTNDFHPISQVKYKVVSLEIYFLKSLQINWYPSGI